MPFGKRNRKAQHVIADVHFEPGKDPQLAPLRCSCGWTGAAGSYPMHRSDASKERPVATR
jgi:hypothetical protein